MKRLYLKILIISFVGIIAPAVFNVLNAPLIHASFSTHEDSWLLVVREIESILNKIPPAYVVGDSRKAKSYITEAYFGVFEKNRDGEVAGVKTEFKAGMEEAIRMNISAKRAFELESMFGDIRKAINRNAALSEIESRIKELIKALKEDAHKLEAMDVKIKGD